MISTVSLNGDLQFRAAELFDSELTEDHEVAKMAEKQLDRLVEKILPVLIYVDQQFGQISGLEVIKENDFSLILDRSGKWHQMVTKDVQQEDQAWRRFVFGKIIDALNYWFVEAIKRKEVHYAALAKRRYSFNKMERGSSLSFRKSWVVSLNYWLAKTVNKMEVYYTAVAKRRGLFNKVGAVIRKAGLWIRGEAVPAAE